MSYWNGRCGMVSIFCVLERISQDSPMGASNSGYKTRVKSLEKTARSKGAGVNLDLTTRKADQENSNCIVMY